MPDPHDLLDLVVVCVVFVGVVLISSSWVRAQVGPHLGRAGQRALIRLELMSDPDLAPDPLWWARRHRQLCADVDRLERLVVTDTWMSATRQLGNRIALRQLLLELELTPEVNAAALGYEAASFSHAASLPAWSTDLDHRDDDRRGSAVEILEIGWGRS